MTRQAGARPRSQKVDSPTGKARFVLICSTPWNTITSLAAWRTLDPNRQASLEVVVIPHPVTGQSLSESVLVEVSDIFGIEEDRIVRLPAYPRARSSAMLSALAKALLPRRGINTVWITPQEPKSYVIKELALATASVTRSSRLVLSDDGLSFNKSLPTRIAHYWATGRRSLAFARPALDVAKQLLVSRLLLMDARITPHLNALTDEQTMVLHQVRDALRPEPHSENVGDVWFLSQPFEQDANVPKGQYYAFLDRQLAKWERDGLDVRVKLHPREVAGRHEWIPSSVLQKALPPSLSETPIELLLRHKRPHALVGLSSTSLLTAAVIGNIPTYSLPEHSFREIEFRWQRAAIVDTIKMLRDLQLPPEQLADLVHELRPVR